MQTLPSGPFPQCGWRHVPRKLYTLRRWHVQWRRGADVLWLPLVSARQSVGHARRGERLHLHALLGGVCFTAGGLHRLRGVRHGVVFFSRSERLHALPDWLRGNGDTRGRRHRLRAVRRGGVFFRSGRPCVLLVPRGDVVGRSGRKREQCLRTLPCGDVERNRWRTICRRVSGVHARARQRVIKRVVRHLRGRYLLRGGRCNRVYTVPPWHRKSRNGVRRLRAVRRGGLFFRSGRPRVLLVPRGDVVGRSGRKREQCLRTLPCGDVERNRRRTICRRVPGVHARARQRSAGRVIKCVMPHLCGRYLRRGGRCNRVYTVPPWHRKSQQRRRCVLPLRAGVL